MFRSINKFVILGTAIGIVISTIGSLTGYYFVFEKRFEEAIRISVNDQLKPYRAHNEALKLYENKREFEAFDKFDECILLYEKNNLLSSEMQSLLSDYLMCVVDSNYPEQHHDRIKSIQSSQTKHRLAAPFSDQIRLAYHMFNTGDLEGAIRAYESLKDKATIQENHNHEAAVYFGLFLCSLAKEDSAKAVSMYKIANAKDPYAYWEWIPNENDRNVERWSRRYRGFITTAAQYKKKWREVIQSR